MSDDDRWTIAAGVGIVLAGCAFIGIAVFHLFAEHHRVVTLLLGGGFPVTAAFGTVLAGGWIARSGLSKRNALHVVGWWGVGTVIAALMGIASVVYEQSHGVVLVDAVYIVTNNMTAGSAGSLLIGHFSVRNRQRAELLAAERNRLATERERLAVLNRVVRHDIRNDMTVVLGWLETLETHVDEQGTDALERVRAASDHVVELTRVAGDYVDVIVGETTPDLRPVSLRDTLETEVKARRDAYPDTSFRIEEIPDVTVRANAMLSSVFRNVLNNAVQHNDKETPTVSVTVEEVGDSVVVQVADDGPGIPDERKESVFGKGERGLDSPGTGIGLYLADTLVSEYGGDIRIEDNEPEGSVFEIRLPLVASPCR